MTNKYDVAIFDFDGTIVCSEKGIYNGIRFTAEKLGLSYLPEHEKDVIGPSLYDSFEKYYKLDQAGAAEAVKIYRSYYDRIGYQEFYLYDGIEECLSKLRACGVKTVIATTKNHSCALKMLYHAGIEELFDYTVGSNPDGSMTEKKDLIKNVMAHHNAAQSRYVMIGDRFFDCDGAASCGIDFIWAQYGFGTLEEFGACPITFIAQTPMQINSYIVNEKFQR